MNEINLFFTCDDAYVPFLAVTLQSIKENKTKGNVYKVKVLHANSISAQSQNIINNEYNKDNIEIEFVDISATVSSVFNDLHTRDYYSKSTYYRLFIPNLYPNLDKALYIDSDIVVLEDIANLYNIDLGDNLVGGVTDGIVASFQELKEYVTNRIGVDKWQDYFNAGVLPMNLKALREFNIEDKFIKLLGAVKFTVAQDQDYLNTLCKNRVKRIDGAWDVMPFYGSELPREKLKLIHYNLAYKPWHHDEIMYEEYFWDYAKRTVYYDQICEEKKGYYDQELSNKQLAALVSVSKREADDKEENERIRKIVNEICSK